MDHFRNDRDGYTDAKGEFVVEVTDKARAEYPNRYTPTIM
jgi:hypothetical protein